MMGIFKNNEVAVGMEYTLVDEKPVELLFRNSFLN